MFDINKSLSQLEINLNRAINVRDFNQEQALQEMLSKQLQDMKQCQDRIETCKDLFKYLTQK